MFQIHTAYCHNDIMSGYTVRARYIRIKQHQFIYHDRMSGRGRPQRKRTLTRSYAKALSSQQAGSRADVDSFLQFPAESTKSRGRPRKLEESGSSVSKTNNMASDSDKRQDEQSKPEADVVSKADFF